jgi:Leucine-rich repeat (LRR) protein
VECCGCDSRLSGTVPASLSTLTSLQWLSLAFNQLTGSLPNLSASTGLAALYMSSNQLSGSLPLWVTACRELKCVAAPL